ALERSHAICNCTFQFSGINRNCLLCDTGCGDESLNNDDHSGEQLGHRRSGNLEVPANIQLRDRVERKAEQGGVYLSAMTDLSRHECRSNISVKYFKASSGL